jgi:hypothetical protein
LAKAHILLLDKQPKLAMAALRQLGSPLSLLPAVVATVVRLSEREGDLAGAQATLEAAGAYWKGAKEDAQYTTAKIQKFYVRVRTCAHITHMHC